VSSPCSATKENKSWLGNRCQRWSRVCFHSFFPLASVPALFAFIGIPMLILPAR
jgi:hypothetical protein